uniref:Uncharacterized protein n=1 Tax=Eutreptiella gymnastica TaxID=73025 RepID=A0A7S1IQY3_9EUGL|mmetsp:Transcript_36911/g.65926  ORF Transcript_36911/g.65926 Transcript_36911/m.65926 type:complete len:126 (+) Transcript_36911:522-899(+)
MGDLIWRTQSVILGPQEAALNKTAHDRNGSHRGGVLAAGAWAPGVCMHMHFVLATQLFWTPGIMVSTDRGWRSYQVIAFSLFVSQGLSEVSTHHFVVWAEPTEESNLGWTGLDWIRLDWMAWIVD